MREFIGCHVERVLARAVATVINLDILERQRTGVGVGAQDAMGRTIVNDRIANGDVIGVMVNAAETTASNIEAFKDVMVRQTKFDGIGPARENWTQPIYANAANRNLVYDRPRPGEDNIAGISCIAVNLDEIARAAAAPARPVISYMSCSVPPDK